MNMRVFFINIAVAVGLLLSLEVSFRIFSSVKNCITGVCNLYYLTRLHTSDEQRLLLLILEKDHLPQNKANDFLLLLSNPFLLQ